MPLSPVPNVLNEYPINFPDVSEGSFVAISKNAVIGDESEQVSELFPILNIIQNGLVIREKINKTVVRYGCVGSPVDDGRNIKPMHIPHLGSCRCDLRVCVLRPDTWPWTEASLLNAVIGTVQQYPNIHEAWQAAAVPAYRVCLTIYQNDIS